MILNDRIGFISNSTAGLLIAAAVSLFVACGNALCQGIAPNDAGITNIEATPLVSLRIEIRGPDKKTVIPYCNDFGRGEFSFCFGDAHLEVLRRGVWEPAGPRKGMLATMGADVDEVRRPAIIESGKTVHFTYSFSKELFGIQKGEKLRFKTNAWTSPESMTNRDPEMKFVSPVFDCP